MTNAQPRLGVVGFGQFGQFMAKHLAPYFTLFAYDAADRHVEMNAAGVQPANLTEIAKLPIIVLAVPVQHLETVLQELGPQVPVGALVLDVSSVKVKPLKLMQQYLGPDVEIVGTHPLFGPQSGKDGITGLRIALCSVRTARLAKVRSFLANTLKLEVIEVTPEEHDQQMAYVQGLSHLISRALHELKIPGSPLATKAYEDLLSMANYLGSDTYDLFLTIERENPYASDMRQRFIEQLANLHQKIGSDA